MTGTSKSAKKAQQAAEQSALQDKALRLQAEARLKREKERAQQLFIRSVRARFGGGFRSSPQSDLSNTLG